MNMKDMDMYLRDRIDEIDSTIRTTLHTFLAKASEARMCEAFLSDANKAERERQASARDLLAEAIAICFSIVAPASDNGDDLRGEIIYSPMMAGLREVSA